MAVNNIYPLVTVENETNQYLKLKFVILEKDWPYPNFDIIVQHNDPMMYIMKELQQRHGGVNEVKLFNDPERNNALEFPICSVKKLETH